MFNLNNNTEACGFLFENMANVSILKMNSVFIFMVCGPDRIVTGEAMHMHIVINSDWYTIGKDYLLKLRHHHVLNYKSTVLTLPLSFDM